VLDKLDTATKFGGIYVAEISVVLLSLDFKSVDQLGLEPSKRSGELIHSMRVVVLIIGEIHY
jgi:hypothetical protein